MKILYLFTAILLSYSISKAQVSTQGINSVCGTAISLPSTACDNAPIHISGVALGGNGGSFDLISGTGTLVDNGDKTAIYYPVVGEGSVTIGFTNDQANGCTGGQTDAQGTINLISVPGTPSNITGSNLVCPWSNPLNYSVVNDLTANNYDWTFPSGTVINSGTTTNAVAVNFGTTAGTVSVTASNSCGVSAASTIYVDVQGMPVNPGPISGPSRICASNIAAATFSITPLPNQIYMWTVPAGASVVTGGSINDNFITLNLSNVTTGTLTLNSGNSCTSTPTPVNFSINTALPIPDICMVTVDDSSKNNIIYWDKSSFPMADTFIVYRDVANNNFMPIGTVSYDSLSMFIDTVRHLYPANGDPNVSSWRYKIAMKDTCGGTSNLSPYHQTMFIQNSFGNFSWNQYQIEGQVIPVPALTGYACSRDDNANNNWAVVQTLSASSTAFTDPSFATFQGTADWRTNTIWAIACNPTARAGHSDEIQTQVVKSKSNISNNRSVGLNTGLVKSKNEVRIYPNPSKGYVTIETEKASAANSEALIIIENMLGQIVYKETTMKSINSINTDLFTDGVYFVKVKQNNTINSTKLIIQK